MSVKRQIGHYKGKNGNPDKDCISYRCTRGDSGLNRCRAFGISTRMVDAEAWKHALEIINNPSLVDQRVNTLRSDDPTRDQRKRYTAKIAEIEQNLKRIRTLLEGEDLDPESTNHYKLRLRQLVAEKAGYEEEMNASQNLHEKWIQLEKRLNELHQFCEEMREKISDPEYIPPYQKKREACELFGINAIIWGKDHTPRFEIKCNPPSIVSILS